MDVNHMHGWLYARTSSALRWHRRYVVLRGSKLEIHGSESLEKEHRNDKDETIHSSDAKDLYKKGAKPRRSYKLASTGTVSKVSKADIYVAKGIGFKQVDLNMITVVLPWSDKYGEEDEEHEDGSGKVVKIRLGADSEKVIEQWRETISVNMQSAGSKLSMIQDELHSTKSDTSAMGEDEKDLPPVEPTMYIANLGKEQLKELTHTKLYRHVGTYNNIEVMEELENPRTYIMSTIIRSHPQTVFEELQLLGRVPGSDIWSSRYESVEDVEILERDESRDVLHVVFKTGMLSAPREMGAVSEVWIARGDAHASFPATVVERYWRLEEDGIFVLNYHSIDHAAAPLPPQTGLCGWNNVRLQCMGGTTISPLKPAYAQGATECLVTQVVHIANSGGYLNIASSYGLGYADTAMVVPFAHNMAYVKHTCETARFYNGNQTVIERLQAAAAEKRAQDAGRSQLALGTSVKAVLAVAKFKKALGGKKHAVKLLPLPSNVDRTMWYDPGAVNFKVRGPDYFTTGVKVQASTPVFDFVALQLFEVDQPINENIVSLIPNHPLMSPDAADAPFAFVVNLMIPGPPNLNAVVYFRCGNHQALDADTPFGRVWRKFLDGDDEERNSRFKLIPTIVEGSWVIKQAVGSTPVIMGKKLRTTYHKGANYIETDVDISNSKVACKVTGMCLPVTKSLVIDMAFLLEPHDEDELPETLLGVVRLKKLDLESREWLPGSHGAAAAKKAN